MDAGAVVTEILRRSELTKAGLAREAGLSRALLDRYLAGDTQPSLAQLERIAAAVGLTVVASVDVAPKHVPESFVAVLDFGDLFPRKEREPLVDLSGVWGAHA